MIQGLNHLTLAVKNLAESFAFYKDVLGFKPLMKSERGAYFLAGDLWFCIEEDSQMSNASRMDYTHFAFTVSRSDFATIREHILKTNAKIWKDNKSEGDSLYFLDPSGHKLEIHVGDWHSRIENYKRSPQLGKFEFFV